MNPRRMHTSKGHHSLQVASNQININSLNWLPYISYNVCCKNFVVIIVIHPGGYCGFLITAHGCLQMDSEKLKKSKNTFFLKNPRQIHVILLCKLFGLKQYELSSTMFNTA